ncbi:MAG: hypothetical protein JNJ53_04620 [Rhizobiales bacterium]|nr:hypothetical protein [Hyphomicrobiales bacterium]
MELTGIAMPESKVADIVLGQLDSTGSKIENVYSKVSGTYAVYRTPERVVIQYADDEKLGGEQRLALAPLNPIRGQIHGLVDGWRHSASPEKASAARLFDRRVADALIVALQGDQTHALDLLIDVKADVLEERTSVARTQYLLVAFACGVALILVLALVAANWLSLSETIRPLLIGAAVGTVGALFSISLAIRSRSILTDLQSRDNAVDAGLRILIGAISAVVLFSIIQSELVKIQFGSTAVALASMTTAQGIAIAVVVAFAAGFSERLIGDLLTESGLTRSGGKAGNPLAGEVPSKRAGERGSEANELNPLGKSKPARDEDVSDRAGPHAHVEDDDADCCIADKTLTPAELTDDSELPEATGGVEKPNP